ncbi:MAG: TlpA family protein disulfide reductase [Candidatus Hydrogenedentes bacterium]|nr:TlpA family protein disulfide reductase [Candidatus Hydrogenedentota bacterium]
MESSEHPLLGKPLPALSLTDWRGEPLDPANQPDRIVIIDFWATWCGPCIGYIPKNKRILEDFGPQGVVLVGICATTGSQDMDTVAEERKITYPIAKDVEKISERALRVRHFPEYFLIDRAGIVRAAALPGSKIRDALVELLAQGTA